MRLDQLLTDDAVLAELGRRLERHRIARESTQAELAEEAGIGRATLQRIERGRSVQMTSLVKLLRTLGLLDALDAAVPGAVEEPIAELERQRTGSRRRARGRRGGSPAPPPKRPWAWGEDEEPRA
jgi:transcriptional regulator with XRE-family HTH domain